MGEIHMDIPQFQIDVTGHAEIWQFRQYVAKTYGGVDGNDPLPWINTHDSIIVDLDSCGVDAYMKSYSTTDGSLQQLGHWSVRFDSSGRAIDMHQDVLWRVSADSETQEETKGSNVAESELVSTDNGTASSAPSVTSSPEPSSETKSAVPQKRMELLRAPSIDISLNACLDVQITGYKQVKD